MNTTNDLKLSLGLIFLAFGIAAHAVVVNPNPAADLLYPNVVVIGQKTNNVTRVTGGSAIIVGPDLVMTAGHVSSHLNATNPNFIVLNGVDIYCTEQILFPDTDGNGYPDVDIKFLKFPANTFPAWSPIAIGNLTGLEIAIVGTGAAGALRTDLSGFNVLDGTHNVRRLGKNVIEGYTTVSYFNPPSYQWTSPYFELDRPNGSTGTYPYAAVANEATFGPLDSGGALYLPLGGTPYVVGNINYAWDGNGNYSSSFNQLLDYGDGGGAVDMNDTRVKLFLAANSVPTTTFRQISGTVAVTGVPSAALTGSDLLISVYRAGTTTLLDTITTKIRANGAFVIPTLATLSVDIFASIPGSLLKARRNQTLNSNGISGQAFTLLMGDADGDNEVTNADYAFWAAGNGLSSGQPGFMIATDFDRDGEITNADYAFWAAGNGVMGDIPGAP